MAIFEVQGPDGAVYEVEAPDERAAAMAFAQVHPQAGASPLRYDNGRGISIEVGARPGEQKPDQTQGFVKGAWNAAGNLAPVMGMLDPMGALRLRQQADLRGEEIAQREAQGHPSGRIGEFAGGLALSAPTAFMGGPAIAGALQGYAMSEGDNLQDRAIDAGMGALGGKVGAKVIEGLSAGVRGVADPMVKELAARGVKLTPGQVLGEAMQRLESKAASLPIVGGDIARGAERFRETANLGALVDALSELDMRLPKGVQAGHDAVSAADDMIGARYDELAEQLALRMDPQLYGDLARVRAEAGALSEGAADVYRRQMADLLQFGDDLTMSGPAFRRAESDLGARAKNYMTSSLASEREIGEVLRSAQDALRDAVTRQNPQGGEALQAAHAGFRKLLPIERAAGAAGARDGVFSGAQLKTASRATDASRRKVASARGEAPMQQYAEAMQRLERAVPNSGTFDRAAAWNPFMIAAGLGAKAGYKVSEGIGKLMTAPRPANADELAELLVRLRRGGGVAGAGAATEVAN